MCIGMLSGCDYHHGVDRVGPTTAMKILKEFKSDGEDKSGEDNNKEKDNKCEQEFEILVKFR